MKIRHILRGIIVHCINLHSQYYDRKNVAYSYDVFDTAITRNLHSPDHIHWRIGIRFESLGLITFSPQVWRTKRVAAETRLSRAKGQLEITLFDIYEALSDEGAININSVNKMMNIECDEELAAASRIEATYQEWVLNKGKYKTIFVSDMYLDGSVISTILKKCGYEDLIIYSSCNIGLTKRHGGIFHYVAEDINVSPKQISHLGDNEQSDVLKAAVAGWRARIFRQSRPNRYEKALFEYGGSEYIASCISGSARSSRLSRHFSDRLRQASWAVSTSVAGPLLTAFVLWILLQAIKKNIKTLFLFARDGEILRKIANILINWLKLDIKIVYFLASRQALFLPSLPSEPEKLLLYLVSHSKGRQVRDIFTELDFEPSVYSNMIGRLGASEDENIDNIGSAFQDFLLENIDVIINQINKAKMAFNLYLKSVGFEDEENAAIVDLGWRGNLQLRFEAACSTTASNLEGYYYNLFYIPESLNGRVNLFSPGENVNANLLETFCAAVHGTVQRYRVSDGNLFVDCADEQLDGPRLYSVQDQQDGICSFTMHFVKSLNFNNCDPSIILEQISRSAKSVFDLFVNYPTFDEALVFGTVIHATKQTHDNAAELAPALTSAKDIAALMIRRSKIPNAQLWRPGVIVRSAGKFGFRGSVVSRLMLNCRKFKLRNTTRWN